jgi:UTP--glucose-1-phosphate uridylyltransferase
MTPKPITKAVIPVGGWATRFLPTVKSYAKHLIPVLDRPQIQWVIEELLGAGITDICIVHREDDLSIKKYFEPNPLLDDYLASTGKASRMDSYNSMMSRITKLTFIPQLKTSGYGNGIPVILAKDYIGDEPFVYLWGDDLTIEANPGHFLSEMIKLYQTHQPDAVVATQEVPWEEVEKYGTMKYHPNPQFPHQVIDIPEKLPRSQAPSNMINGARFIVSPKVFDILEHLEADRGEIWFTQATSVLAKTGVVITADYREYDALWNTTGDPQNWLKANLILAMRDPNYQNVVKSVIVDPSTL